MQDNSQTNPIEGKTIKEDFNDYFIIFLLGWMIAMFAPIVIGRVFNERSYLFELLLNNTILLVLFSLGLLILPIISSSVTHKNHSIRKFWLAIFWLTLLIELIMFTVVMVITNPN